MRLCKDCTFCIREVNVMGEITGFYCDYKNKRTNPYKKICKVVKQEGQQEQCK